HIRVLQTGPRRVCCSAGRPVSLSSLEGWRMSRGDHEEGAPEPAQPPAVGLLLVLLGAVVFLGLCGVAILAAMLLAPPPPPAARGHRRGPTAQPRTPPPPPRPGPATPPPRPRPTPAALHPAPRRQARTEQAGADPSPHRAGQSLQAVPPRRALG